MSEDTRRIGERFYELVNERRLDELVGLFAEEYTGHGGMGAGGRDGLRQDLEGFLAAFGDLHFAVEATVVEGPTVAVRTTMTGTHDGPFAGAPASGNRIEVAGCDVFRLHDGRIVESWSLCDSATLLVQTGALGAPVRG